METNLIHSESAEKNQLNHLYLTSKISKHITVPNSIEIS